MDRIDNVTYTTLLLRGEGVFFCLFLNSSLDIVAKIWYFFGTYLDFSSLPCYTYTRYKTPKNKVLQGFRRFPA